jgi:hypothetical protein
MSQMLVFTGVDASEAALGLDVAHMFHQLGLSKGRQLEFHAVQDNKHAPKDWLPKRRIRKAYQEVECVLAAHSPRVVIDLHHAFVHWKCFEVQVFSGLCAESPSFRAWAKSLVDVRVLAGGSDDEDKGVFCYQLPSMRDRLWADIDFITVEVIPAFGPLKERMKIPGAPLTSFDFPGGTTYRRQIELLAHVIAGVHDHHPWLNKG